MEGDADQIQKQIEERISELPADIQNAVLSSDFGQKIQAVGAGNKLHIDQIQELNDFTMLMMLGFMNDDEYRREVVALVGGDAAVAQKVSEEVNQKILLPIRESMKAFAATQAAPQEAIASTPAAVEVVPAQSTPVTTLPPTPAPAPSVPMVPKVDMHPADIALTQPTIAKPLVNPSSNPAAPAAPKPIEQKVEPPKPQDYKADPYREPIS